MNKTELIDYLLDENTSPKNRILALDKAREDNELTTTEIIEYAEEVTPARTMKTTEEGFFGNVWVRSQYFPKASVIHQGHKHVHDHVSLLQYGSVKVIIEGEAEKIFHAPTFITIKANKEHQIVALEDETLTWCVFALRKTDGTLCDYYNGDNTPYGHVPE